MWNEDDGGYQDDGGNNSMFSSPTQQAEKSSKPKCIGDVTIKQILEGKEEGVRLRDPGNQVVKVVGIVKMVDVTSLKIRYVIADHTGTITCLIYLDNDTDAVSQVVENTYCVVTGSVRTQGDSKHIMIFSIKPVTDFNFILAHMLTVVHMPLKLDSLSSEPEVKSVKTEMLSSYGGESNNDIGSDVDPRYRRVYDVISRSMSENGMNVEEIQSALSTRLPVDQIRNALEYLVGEGHVFTTIDENHYKSINSNY